MFFWILYYVYTQEVRDLFWSILNKFKEGKGIRKRTETILASDMKKPNNYFVQDFETESDQRKLQQNFLPKGTGIFT